MTVMVAWQGNMNSKNKLVPNSDNFIFILFFYKERKEVYIKKREERYKMYKEKEDKKR